MEEYIKKLVVGLNNCINQLKEENQELDIKVKTLSASNIKLKKEYEENRLDLKKQKYLEDVENNSTRIIIQSLNLASKFKDEISVLLDNMKTNANKPKQLLNIIEKYIKSNADVYKYDFKSPDELDSKIKSKIYSMMDRNIKS